MPSQDSDLLFSIFIIWFYQQEALKESTSDADSIDLKSFQDKVIQGD
jgi:hypothetical protein